MRFLIYFFMITVACASVSFPVMAEEVFLWRAPQTQFSATFPDDWRQTSGQKPDDVLTILAPGENDHASCRLRQREDRRFVIYPRQFAGPIQRAAYSQEFWNRYISEFAAATLNAGHDNAGLGHGFAGYADFSFIPAEGTKVQKRGVMLATVYNDKAYIFECSSEAQAFDKWHHTFLNILKSVDFRNEYAQEPNGHYRSFHLDPELLIHNAKPVDIYVY